MPWLLQQYLVDLVTDRLRETDLCPWGTFAEGYLRLYSATKISDFQSYGDQALLFCSLMPKYGDRRGLDMTYYASLGISAYYTAGDLAHDNRYTQLGNWFYHLQQFLDSWLHQDRCLNFVDVR
jgi:hypothetical protein